MKKNFKIFEKRRWQTVTIYSAKVNGVKVYLIEDKKKYFSKPKIYGYKYDIHRFSMHSDSRLFHLIASSA